MPEPVRIVAYSELDLSADLHRALDRIFFEASNTKIFPTEAERALFRERWLGRYLEKDSGLAYVAVSQSGEISGYVVGSTDDPAMTERFSDIWYFARFKSLTRLFPAHLHVNLAPEYRGRRIGEQLVETFNDAARAARTPGVHVVTGKFARNVGFYTRIGFAEVGSCGEGERQVVMLARELY